MDYTIIRDEDDELTVFLPYHKLFNETYNPDGYSEFPEIRIIFKDTEELETPTVQQINALEYFLKNSFNINKYISDFVYEEREVFLEATWLDIETIKKVKDLYRFSTINIRSNHKDGISYIGLTGECSWDPEHGFGVMMFKDKIVDFGDWETGGFRFNEYDNISKKYSLEPLKEKRNRITSLSQNIQTKEAKRNDFNWLDRFGSISIFLKNDLRLILRTKRAKSTVIMGFSFVFYGFLIMFSNDLFGDWWLFVGLFFSTGGFMLTFCGLVPSWDSKHYSLMMCQNITYLDYLKSKWYLGIIGTTVMTIMASFIYSYFGIFYIVTIICAGLYNLGINSYVTLWAGAFNKSAIDLESNKNAFGDKKSFNTKTMLMTIPQLIGPVLIFSYVSSNFDSFIAAYVIGAIGIIGMFFRNWAFKIIVKTYKSEKYSTLSAYKQTN